MGREFRYDLAEVLPTDEERVGFLKRRDETIEIWKMREGASWKNDYRYWYLVYKGKLYLLADVDSSKRKRHVIDYLSGELTMEEMFDALGVKVEEGEGSEKPEVGGVL
jgi:hypothetical protein